MTKKPIKKPMKPWSVTTTTRSPYRLKNQLQILVDNFEGVEWTKENQIKLEIFNDSIIWLKENNKDKLVGSFFTF